MSKTETPNNNKAWGKRRQMMSWGDLAGGVAGEGGRTFHLADQGQSILLPAQDARRMAAEDWGIAAGKGQRPLFRQGSRDLSCPCCCSLVSKAGPSPRRGPRKYRTQESMTGGDGGQGRRP